MTQLRQPHRRLRAIDELAQRLRQPRQRDAAPAVEEPPSREVAIRALSGARHNLREIELALVGADAAERRRVAPLLQWMRQAQAGARMVLRHAARPRVRLAHTVSRATRRPVVTVATVDSGDDPGGGDSDDDGSSTGRDPAAPAGQLSIGVEKTQTETTTCGGRDADA